MCKSPGSFCTLVTKMLWDIYCLCIFHFSFLSGRTVIKFQLVYKQWHALRSSTNFSALASRRPILFQDTLDVDGAGGVDLRLLLAVLLASTIPVAGDVKYHPFRSASSFRQRSLICPTKNVDLVHCDQCRFNKRGAHAPLSSGWCRPRRKYFINMLELKTIRNTITPK